MIFDTTYHITYEDFKAKTLKAERVIREATAMQAVSDEFNMGFLKAMREAREIFLRLEEAKRIQETIWEG